MLPGAAHRRVPSICVGAGEQLARARKPERRRAIVYARKTDIRFPPSLRADVAGVVRGLVPILKARRGNHGLDVLTDPEAGAGMIVSFWETEADARAAECSSSYIAQMSMMSSFLYEALVPKTYEVEVRE